jgi:hypothetical protein
MTPKKKTKSDRLRSAAIVKLKYQMLAGSVDTGFQTVFAGVLKDLNLTEEEVDRYIEENAKELKQACLEGS